MTQHIAFCSDMANPYYDAVLQGVREAVCAHPELELLSWMESYRFPLAALKYLKPGGLLLGPVSPEQVAALPPGLPAVGFSNTFEEKPFPAVVNDDVAVGRLAARALLDAGYGGILILAASDQYHAKLRTRGALTEAEAAGVPTWQLSLTRRKPGPGETFQDVWNETNRRFEDCLRNLPPNTGLLSLNHSAALEALALLQDEWKRPVPGDYGIVLADLPSQKDTPFAYVELDAERIGRVATERLLGYMRDPAAPAEPTLSIPPRGVCTGATLRR